jgi:dGTPase
VATVKQLEYTFAAREREFPEGPVPDDARSEFERDRARIVHSLAFRRLQGKTQVYGLGESDYYRSRLTHSVEVAQIGKALALKFGADPDLVSAICLAHDIGHPPFGHAGEYALRECLEDHDGFNGNAQNIAILARVERKKPSYPGLNLTRATLDGIVKYPVVLNPRDPHSKGFYKDDREIVAWFKPDLSRKSFECEIMNWADDVAYSSHDLEDALVIGTIRRDDLERDDRLASIYKQASTSYRKDYRSHDARDPITEQDVTEAVVGIIEGCISSTYGARADRLGTIKTFIGKHITYCVANTSKKKSNPSAKTASFAWSIDIPSAVVKRVEIYKAAVMVCVILTSPVLTLQAAGRRVLRDLFETYGSVKNRKDLINLYPLDLRWRFGETVDAVESGIDSGGFGLQQFARNYIAGMTDLQAESLWKRLYVPHSGSLFTPRI